MSGTASPILTGGVWDVANTWSKSKLGALDTCAYKFFRAYVLGERRPPTAAMAFGNGWDGMADGYYAEKRRTGRDLAAHDAQELWRASFEVAAEQVGDWNDDMGAMVDEGAALALVWHPEAQLVQPIAVQESFRVELVDSQNRPFALTGKPDTIARPMRSSEDAPVHGIDDKTTSRKWGDKERLTKLDALSYSIGMREGLGIENLEVDADGNRVFRYHVAVRKKVPEVQVLERGVSDADVEGFIRYVSLQRQRVIDSYRSGTWTPNRQHMMCSRRWCGWWRECEQEWSGRVPD